MRELLVKVFRHQGFTVTEAADGGASAISVLASGSVDLLVSDIRMAPNDGLALTALAKAASPRTKILLMTAYGGRPEEREARALGADAYMRKPFSMDEILAAARALLAGEAGQGEGAVRVRHRKFPARTGKGGEFMARSVKSRVFSLSLLLAGFFAGFAPEAMAIPAFARKYRTSCTTCHVAIPKRNAFGEAFRRNGYQIPAGDERYIKEEPVSLGAEAWKEMWPESIWPGAIPQSIPFSAYVHQRFVYDGPTKDAEFDAPHEFELLVGNTLGRNIGFFGEWVFYEKGVQGPGLKRFFIQFSNLFEKSLGKALSLRVGRLEPGIADGYKDADRITMEHPITLDYRVTNSFRIRDPQSGIEIAGVPHRNFEYVLGFVNGQGASVNDPNNHKDTYARVGFKLGGMGLDGSGGPEGDTLPIADNYVDDSVMVGAYGYWGRVTVADASKQIFDNDFRRFGVDARLNYRRNYLLAGFVRGKDENPFNTALRDVQSTAWFVELDRVFLPWVIGALRYERLQVDGKSSVTQVTPNVTLLVRANIRVSLEAFLIPSLDKDKFRTFKANIMFVF
jgi:CheY-like chemotaxis protein